ncbi:MAG: ATP-binding protein [Alphaproteobacteria bacterium]
MEDYEKLGAFYLGRGHDLAAKTSQGSLLLYDSKDLTTHAVCVGMTGSGKTGLCLALLEEAAIDGIPAIAIDPKGDIADLLLTFPGLAGEDFAPWVNPEDAARKGVSVEDYAKSQAELWRKGLADWGQDSARVKRLRDAVDLAIYTPGSSAGIPVSILKSFAVPEQAVLEDGELLRERISTTVTSLLGLLKIDADPLQSREHILISTIVNQAWSQGKNVDLPSLIASIQTPPMAKVGILDLESFYPQKDRFALVMALNNLIASPGFGAWMEGTPLDIGSILRTPQGKPRIAIFSIAHLNDAERMFFVSLLLNQVLGWMRGQSGTTSLRSILYMDEIFGYFPPTANPPSKQPLLTLIKQARAYGLGLVLATQNPVDLDYKGLANAGTWFIGRLQTERDKTRVLDGLEGASAAAGAAFDRQTMDKTLSALGNRIFLLNNVHEDQPVVFETRWAMSYLRGPLTRAEIKRLMDPWKAASRTPAAVSAPAAQPATAAAAAAPSQAAPAAAVRPSVPGDVKEVFIPARGAGAGLVYRPMLLGAAKVNFADAKTKVDVTTDAATIAPITDEAIPVNWDNAEALELALADLETAPAAGISFATLPAAAGKAKNYAQWTKDFGTWLYGSQKVELLRHPGTGAISQAGESERDFRARLDQGGREQRDAAIEALRKKYAPKLAALQERQRRAEQSVEREHAQARQAQIQTAISVGAALLTAFTGRKMVSASTLGRATTAVRGVGRSVKEQQDIGIAQESVGAIQQQIAAIEDEFKAESAALESSLAGAADKLETLTVKPKKTGISVQLVALAWAPYREDAGGTATPAWT